MSNKSSKILLYATIILIALSVGATYYKYIMQWDFVIINDLDEESLDEE